MAISAPSAASPDEREFVAHCLELLAPIGRPRARRMFGGHGLYVDDIFIALISGQRLYLKADDLTRPSFDAAGCPPFSYTAAGTPVSLRYFAAPDDAMESPPLMQPWARLALAAALRARVPKPAAARPVRKATPRKGSASKAPRKL